MGYLNYKLILVKAPEVPLSRIYKVATLNLVSRNQLKMRLVCNSRSVPHAESALAKCGSHLEATAEKWRESETGQRSVGGKSVASAAPS